jgi:hypothetical protein
MIDHAVRTQQQRTKDSVSHTFYSDAERLAFHMATQLSLQVVRICHTTWCKF